MDLRDLPPTRAGALFANRFEIDRVVGTGGMGRVYRALDRYSGAWVALKVLHESHEAAHDASRFLQEARFLSELGHPHIVSYVAHGQSLDGRPFLAMEWLEGQDLAERLRQGPLDLQSALRLLEHVADGLAAAHRQGVIHRDLKPANLFLVHGKLEAVKILDFGIARSTLSDVSFTKTGTAIGTPEYMAPEQARGLPEISAAADTFSLGCVFHQCVTGKAPFTADSMAAILVRILFDEAPLLAHPPPEFPPAVLSLLKKMLSKEVSQRFPDAVTLLAAVRSLREAESVKPAMEVRAPVTGPVMLSGYTLANRDGDQELTSAVIVQPPSESSDATSTISTERIESGEFLVSSLKTMGVRVEIILGGALVVTVPAMESAVDQVTQAARAALLIKRLWPQSRVALATGRGVVKGQIAVGEVANRALNLLAEQDSPALPSDPQSPQPDERTASGVWTDRLSAQLLPTSFQITHRGKRSLLIREQESMDESRPLLGKSTPCVGREAELATLEGHLATCLNEGEFRGVVLIGPPGSGKSRIRHELLRRMGQDHTELRILQGRGELLSAGTPYRILAGALRGFFGLLGELSPELLCERLEALAAACNTGEETDIASHILPEFLGELSCRSLPEERYPALRTARQDPSLMQFQLRRTFIAWLEHECRKGPLVFLLEDLHWGDALTVALFDYAMQELPASPWFLLAIARPEIQNTFPNLWQGRPVQTVALKALGRKACERLIQHALGNKLPPAAVAKLIEQSAGNALFLEELIRVAAEENPDSLPETVLAMLQARIGRLPVEARRTLCAASVSGQIFWSDGLAAALNTAADDRRLLESLQSLISSELVERQLDSSFPGQVQYGFRHTLMREAAYALLAESDRTALHRQAGLFLAEQGGVEPRMVAEHFLRGQEVRRAIPWFLRAARHALDSNDLPTASACVKQALDARPDSEELSTLRAIQMDIAYWSGDYPRCAALAEEALLQLPPGTVRWYQAMAHALVSRGRTNDRGQLQALCDKLLEVPPSKDAVAEKVTALCLASHSMRVSVPYERLEQLIQAGARLIEQHQVTSPQALAQYHEAMAHLFSSEPAEALQHVEKALSNYEQAGDIRNLLIVRCHVARGRGLLGGGQDAERLIRATIATCQKVNFLPGLAMARLSLGSFLVRERRDLAEARQSLDAARAWYRQTGFLTLVKSSYLLLIELACIEGSYMQALEHIAEARTIAKQMGTDEFYFRISCAMEAWALLGLGRSAEALPVARQGYAVPRSCRRPGLNSWEHLPGLVLAEVLVALGHTDEARQVVGILFDWLQHLVQSIPRPEWRSQCLRTSDYARIAELADSFRATQKTDSAGGGHGSQ